MTAAPTWPPTTGPPPGGVTPSTARGPASPGSSSGEMREDGMDFRVMTDYVRLVQREVPGSREIASDPACIVWGRA